MRSNRKFNELRNIKVEVDFMLYQKDMALEKYLNEIKSEYKIYINPDLQI